MSFRIALAQIDPIVGDIDGNVDRILTAWRQVAATDADLVVFTELAVVGYPPEDLLLEDEFVTANHEAVGSIPSSLSRSRTRRSISSRIGRTSSSGLPAGSSSSQST